MSVCCESCVLSGVSATSCSLVQRISSDCGASLCAIMNEKALAHWGLSRQEQTNKTLPILVQFTLKGTAIPIQAWTGPEGSRSLRLPDFKTIGT